MPDPAYHRLVPRGVGANLRYRRWLLGRCRRDPSYRAAVRKMCAADVLYYTNTFVWQTNPTKRGADRLGPFVTWDFQEAAVGWVLARIEAGEDGVIEKSREMGASWINLIVMDWLALFRGWQKFLCISHTEKAVDAPDEADSLFWKVQFMHRHLPEWLVPPPTKRKLGFAYPGTHSAVTGTATTGRSGVGGRASAIFLDEFSKQDNDYEILGNTADTSPARVFNGTHYGVGTAFHDLTRRPDMKKLVLHWVMHPGKNRLLYRWNPDKPGGPGVESVRWDAAAWAVVPCPPHPFPADYRFVTDGRPTGGPFPGVRSPWYDRECERRGSSRDVAMHLDIDPQGSAAQFFDPLTVHRLIKETTYPPFWRGDVHYERDSGRSPELVEAPGGPLVLWLVPPARDRLPPRPYAMGADVAAGTGATPTCFEVIDATTGEQVAQYVNANVAPDEAARVWVALQLLFKDDHGDGALGAWESAGPGLKFGATVMEIGPGGPVYYRRDEFGDATKVSDKAGWVPHPANKRLLLEDLRAALGRGECVARGEAGLRDCLAFSYDARGNIANAREEKSADPSAGRVNHADLVIAKGLAWKMAKERYVTREGAVPAGPPASSIAGRRARQDQDRREREGAWR